MKAIEGEAAQQAAVVSAHAVHTTRIEARLIEVVRNTPGSNVKRSAPRATAAVMSTTFTINETMGHPIPANASVSGGFDVGYSDASGLRRLIPFGREGLGGAFARVGRAWCRGIVHRLCRAGGAVFSSLVRLVVLLGGDAKGRSAWRRASGTDRIAVYGHASERV
eukprot:4142607-Pleurochrysis_carterae.AAC.1